MIFRGVCVQKWQTVTRTRMTDYPWIKSWFRKWLQQNSSLSKDSCEYNQTRPQDHFGLLCHLTTSRHHWDSEEKGKNWIGPLSMNICIFSRDYSIWLFLCIKSICCWHQRKNRWCVCLLTVRIFEFIHFRGIFISTCVCCLLICTGSRQYLCCWCC